MTDPRVRLRPEIAAMPPYRQGAPAPASAVKLSSNENPFEPLPGVLEAIGQAARGLNRYPDGSNAALRERLAARFGVGLQQVHVGAGSVTVLAELVTAASGPGDEIVYPWRSFEMYPLLPTASGATGVPVPLTAEGRHDLDAMAAAVTERTRLVFLCSPNNPTGPALRTAEVEAFLTRVPREVLVVLDEAYIEFVTAPDAADGLALLQRHPNLVVARTFSKAWGLAGMRVGYAVGPEYVLDAARAVAVPFGVSALAQAAAEASLDREDELMARVAQLVQRRSRVWQGLTEQGWAVPEAQGNFVWLPTGAQTPDAAARFAQAGLIVRALGEGLRISIGEQESVEALLRVASEIVEK